MARKWDIVRFRDDEPEMRCRRCSEYWPVTVEFWNPDRGTAVCRSCHAEDRRRQRDQARRTEEALERQRVREERRAADALDRKRIREELANQARERKRARDRARYARLMADPAKAAIIRARRRVNSKRYYERHQLDVLERRRAAYADALDRPLRTNMGRRRIAA